MESFAYHEQYQLEDEHWWFRGRRAIIWSLLEETRTAGPERILDAGCGTGRNLVEFAPLGTVTGLDPAAEALAYCRERGLTDVRAGRLEELPFEADAFTLALATDVLEHVEDDLAALYELHRVLAPGARLLATVPAYSWLWSRHDVDYHHFRRYTLRRLLSRVREGGFVPIRWTYFNSFLLPPIAALRLAAHLRGGDEKAPQDLHRTPRAVNDALTRLMRAEAAVIARGGRFPAGVSIGLVAIRPGAVPSSAPRAVRAPAAL